MTVNLKLEALTRTTAEDSRQLIKSGFIPAVVYGPSLKTNKLVKIKTNELNKVFVAAGESTLIDLSIDGKVEGKVLIKEEQINPLKDTTIHVDLYEVDMAKEIYTDIPLHFIGVSKAVVDGGGVLVKSINEIEVKCLPADLVSHIDIDLSALINIHDVIKIHDIQLPKGIKLTTETDDVVATVTELTIEKEEPVVAPVAEGEATAAAPAAGAEAKKEEGKK